MSLYKDIPHDAATGHVTGSSQYIDDRPFLKNELHVGIVGAPVAKGKIIGIDHFEASKVLGVIGVYTGADFSHNLWGTIVPDQPILASDQIGYIDEPVCIVAAETKEALEEAKKKIQVRVQEEKPIFSIDQAIHEKKFMYESTPFIVGDVEAALKKSKHRLQGHFEIGGQEHFYLESQAAISYPQEDGQIEVHSSSQHPTETQHVVAKSLGLPFSKVVCIVRRMGGAFGGKESQAAPIAAMAALVTAKTGRPARLVLTKDQDMQVTGKRHPFKNEYEVGFDEHGKILALKVKVYADGGAYTDLSPSILDRALFHIDGAYFIENCHITGQACRTNNPSNTAFRGFGGPQGTATIESIIEDIAIAVGRDAFEIRKLNCYQDQTKDMTPYGQKVTHNHLPELFTKIHQSSNYSDRVKSIQKFNQTDCGKVRGISCTAVKFGIAFTAKYLNQGNALVHVHRDGTVQVSTGATEMGQGVNTKIRQTVASAFEIDFQQVQVMATSTEKNANTAPTAASSGADINCAAAQIACLKIKERLAAFLINPEGRKNRSWQEVVNTAYLNRISLSEYSHYKTEGIGFDKKTGKGTPFKYYSSGTAVSEVEIDEFTGEMKIVQVDILMDLGRMQNPGIDRGQVIGGFIQGVGWMTTENLYYHSKGNLISHSPTTYKIPNVQDFPRVMNINFLENKPNPENIFGSKAVGEPPLLLASSVWCAVKNAISYRAKGKGFSLRLPATNEVNLMALTKLKGPSH